MEFRSTSIVIGLLVVAFLAFAFMYSGGVSGVYSGLQAERITGGSPIGAFLRQISAIKTVSLDRDVFSNPVLSALRDQSREISPESKGRANPFAPIGNRQAASIQHSIDTPIVVPVKTNVTGD